MQVGTYMYGRRFAVRKGKISDGSKVGMFLMSVYKKKNRDDSIERVNRDLPLSYIIGRRRVVRCFAITRDK